MKLLNKGHATVVKAASKDATRFVLNSVLLQETKNGLKVVATDGRMLAIVEDKKLVDSKDFPANVIPANAENSATEAIVPADAIVSAVKSMPKSRTLPILQNVAVVMGVKHTILGTTDLANPIVQTAKNIEEKYPNYEMVVPKSDPKDFVIAFSPALLIRACQIAADFGLDTIRLEFKTSLDPVKITGNRNDQDLTIVVMPMKI